MLSRIVGAIKRIFGGAESEFEDAKTDPGIPTPAPAPTAKAPPAPTPAPTPAPVAKKEAPAPEATPTPEEAPVPVAAKSVVIKGVEVSDAASVLNFANSASEDALKAAGIKGAGLKALLGARPVATAEALGTISGFGKKSIENLANGAN